MAVPLHRFDQNGHQRPQPLATDPVRRLPNHDQRPAYAATNSSRVVMLIRLILDPAEKDRSGANQMRQWVSFGQHSSRGNAPSHPDRRATYEAGSFLIDRLGAG